MKVTVLLSTYNGEKYIREQIESILSQINMELLIFIRDDGSTDSTCDILNEYQDLSLLRWYSGSNLGPALSFMDLIYNAPQSDYYAFCDQDDFWLPEKLYVAINKLDKQTCPALYLSKYTLVDSNLTPINQSLRSYKCNFSELFVTSPATGCTMLFNKKLIDVVRLYKPSYIAMHDAWVYKICLVIDGFIFYDNQSYILYRQHNNNVVGGQKSFLKKWKRRFEYFYMKAPKTRSRSNRELLKGFSNLISEDKKCVLSISTNYHLSLFNAFKFLSQSSFKELSLGQYVLFVFSVLLRKY